MTTADGSGSQPGPDGMPTPEQIDNLVVPPPAAAATGPKVPVGRFAGLAAGVALVAGGAVFALSQQGSDGPESPTDAVAELLEAASNEDILGVMAAIHPDERANIQPGVEGLFSELQRLEVLNPSFDLGAVGGFDLEYSDVTYEEIGVRDDLARVRLTGGTFSARITGADIPIGDFVADLLDEYEVDISELDESESEAISFGADDFIAAVKTDDGWRVSLGYTLAEMAREGTGQPVPAKGGGLQPLGSDSPAAAVEDMTQAMLDLDLAEVIARLSPQEFGVLQEYSPLYEDFLDEVDSFVVSFVDEVDFGITLNSLDTETDADGAHATVYVRGFDISVRVEGENLELVLSGECLRFSGTLADEILLPELVDTPFADGEACSDELLDYQEDLLGQTLGILELPVLPQVGGTADVGIATLRTDGFWYVAPMRTGSDAMLAALAVYDREALDEFVEFFEEMAGVYEESAFEQSFVEVGDPFAETTGTTILFGDESQAGAGYPPWDFVFEFVSPRVPSGAAGCVTDYLYLTLDVNQMYDLLDSLAAGTEAEDPYVRQIWSEAGDHCG